MLGREAATPMNLANELGGSRTAKDSFINYETSPAALIWEPCDQWGFFIKGFFKVLFIDDRAAH